MSIMKERCAIVWLHIPRHRYRLYIVKCSTYLSLCLVTLVQSTGIILRNPTHGAFSDCSSSHVREQSFNFNSFGTRCESQNE